MDVVVIIVIVVIVVIVVIIVIIVMTGMIGIWLQGNRIKGNCTQPVCGNMIVNVLMYGDETEWIGQIRVAIDIVGTWQIQVTDVAG